MWSKPKMPSKKRNKMKTLLGLNAKKLSIMWLKSVTGVTLQYYLQQLLASTRIDCKIESKRNITSKLNSGLTWA